MKKILLLGASGGIGKAIKDLYSQENVELFCLNSKNINFAKDNSGKKIFEYLDEIDPDIIINCAGVLGTNMDNYNNVFDINFKPNWEIIKYFSQKPILKSKKFIMIGSSAYSSGRKNYILYAASKAAVYNLFLSSCALFQNSNLILGLINPPRIKTKMIEHLLTELTEYLTPQDFAKILLNFEKNLEHNTSIDLGVK